MNLTTLDRPGLSLVLFTTPRDNGNVCLVTRWGGELEPAAENVTAEVVGIVGHFNHGLDGSVGEKPQIYFSFYQLPDEVAPVFRSEISLVVQAKGSIPSVMPAVRNTVHEEVGGSF